MMHTRDWYSSLSVSPFARRPVTPPPLFACARVNSPRRGGPRCRGIPSRPGSAMPGGRGHRDGW
eukprot:7156140-Pyramimonas_sp.AAC.1